MVCVSSTSPVRVEVALHPIIMRPSFDIPAPECNNTNPKSGGEGSQEDKVKVITIKCHALTPNDQPTTTEAHLLPRRRDWHHDRCDGVILNFRFVLT